MSIILFIVVLVVLILVHETGHFLAARGSGVRVDEFGIGFPPAALKYKPKKSETTYSLNWIPLGGFVKIFGEEATDESLTVEEKERNFAHKSKLTQVWILAAGVVGNIVAAWLLLSIGFVVGLPASVESFDERDVTDAHIAITGILPDGPSSESALMAGDRLISISRGSEERVIDDLDDLGEFLGTQTEEVVVFVERAGSFEEVEITPVLGLLDGSNNAALGVAIDKVGIVTLLPHEALWEGGRATIGMTGAIAVGLGQFFGDIFSGEADFEQIAGPVGIVGLVGDASALGFVYLLSFTALISINLALINLIPVPALDGGRILFVVIEAIKGSPIKPKVANIANTVGFALLILLMLVVTYNDIVKLVSN